MSNKQGVHGSCLCGGVEFIVSKFTRGVVACHCTQCRKTSGNYVAATKARNTDISIISDRTLTWYRSSETAERGFCNCCGGNMFWRKMGDDAVSIMAGPLDNPTGLQIEAHIYTDDAGDFYHIDGNQPGYPQGN